MVGNGGNLRWLPMVGGSVVATIGGGHWWISTVVVCGGCFRWASVVAAVGGCLRWMLSMGECVGCVGGYFVFI